MNREEYQAKQQARVDRLRKAADRTDQESQERLSTADQMASAIPFGQPILIGHYSEGRDRRYRERIQTNIRKGLDAKDKAASLRRRAEAAESNRTIFSDDPDAAEKLGAKAARLQQRQEMMKAANKLVRKGDKDGLAEMGFSLSTITQLLTPDFCGRIGFPAYELSNNNANIRRIKQRIKKIAAHADDETSEIEIGPVRIVDSVDANQLQVFFPDKPTAEVRTALKRSGFHWTPSIRAWQRHRNDYASQEAKRIVATFYGDDNEPA